MNRDDIVRMALKACIAKHGLYWTCQQEELERFAALVVAAEREAMIKAGWRQCAEGQSTTQFCGLLETAVKAEREECAKVCEEFINPATDVETDSWDHAAEVCAAAIRARGEQ